MRDSFLHGFLSKPTQFLVATACVGIAAAVLAEERTDRAATEAVTYDYKIGAEPPATNDVPAIQPWKTVVLDKDYRGAWFVSGDLDGDGQPDIITCQTIIEPDHPLASAVAQRLDGSVIWIWGDSSKGRASLGSDVPCQIYDWDGDGKNEVVLLTRQNDKSWLIELDGATGKEKRRFQIPDGSCDCIVFCNLSGGPRATDVLVKTRYTQIWAFDREGRQRWTCEKPGGHLTAHQPRPIDMDGDRKDEIQAGFAMLNPDGSLRWTLNDEDPAFKVGKSMSAPGGHLDCARVFEMAANLDETRLVLTFCASERIAMVNGHGRILWNIPHHHFESVDIGKVCADVPGPQIVVDIPYAPYGHKPVWVLDGQGRRISEIITDESRFHRLIDWHGNGIESIIVGEQPAMYDGATGKRIATFAMPLPPGESLPPVDTSGEREEFICWTGDMTGDGVPDAIYGTNPGTVLFIYENQHGKRPQGHVPVGTGVNVTLY